MFKSTQRAIAIPQAEHQQLAGILAFHWGNQNFARPPVPFESFVAGVGLHDRAYGALDNLPIGELSDDAWMALTRRGFDLQWSDPIADIIARMHLKRLVGYSDEPARQALAAHCASEIQAQIEQHQLDAAVFARTDRITNLCDRISFDFCFEAPAEGTINIFPDLNRDEQIAVTYRVNGSVITVDPWPFAVDQIAGYIVGYRLPAYPARLDPVLVPYDSRVQTY